MLANIDSDHRAVFALTINASILILAAATFHKAGRTDVAELSQAHSFLAPLLGSALAPTLFAIALICCGLNSTDHGDARRADRDGGLSRHLACRRGCGGWPRARSPSFRRRR